VVNTNAQRRVVSKRDSVNVMMSISTFGVAWIGGWRRWLFLSAPPDVVALSNLRK